MKAKNLLFVLVGIVLLPSLTQAAVTTFDFRHDLFKQEANVEGVVLNAEPGGSPITVIPRGFLIGSPQADNADAYMTDWGLGVRNLTVAGDDHGLFFDRTHVDGKNGGEFLRLEFSGQVKITQVLFSFVGPFERFDLAIDGVDVDMASVFGSDTIMDLAPLGGITSLVIFPDTLPFGKTWDFYARNTTDEWNIEGIQVIPEPSTFVIWSGFAVGAVLWRRRRRRKTS